MKLKNKYYNRSRITEGKFREIIKYFSADLTAEKILIYYLEGQISFQVSIFLGIN